MTMSLVILLLILSTGLILDAALQYDVETDDKADNAWHKFKYRVHRFIYNDEK